MSKNQTVFAEVQADLDAFLPLFMEKFKAGVEGRTPVRSGALRGGWEVQVSDTEATLTNTQPYASFVEFGTRHMAPVGMVRTTTADAIRLTKETLKELGQ